MYYSWASEDGFNIWHSAVKNVLGIPHPNLNHSTQSVNEEATWTTQYTQLMTDDEGVLYAKVSDKIAEQFPENLGSVYQPVYVREDEI